MRYIAKARMVEKICSQQCSFWKGHFDDQDYAVDCTLFKIEIRRMPNVKRAYEEGDIIGLPFCERCQQCLSSQVEYNPDTKEIVLDVPE